MTARHWRGWTELRNADAYETLLKTAVPPKLRGAGYLPQETALLPPRER
jgi:hypothetical protein